MIAGTEALLFGLASLIGFALAVHATSRWPGSMLGAVLLVTVLESTRDFALSPHSATNALDASFYIGHSGVIFSVGAIQIHIQDLIAAVAGVAGIIGLSRFRGSPIEAACLAGLVLLVGLGIVTFAQELNIQTAVNSWRRWELALALLLYGMTTRRGWRWRDLDWLIAAGLLMCTLAVIEISIHGLGSASGWTFGGGVKVNGRPIAEDGALVVLAAAWATALRPGRWTAPRAYMLIAFIATVLVSQQRTVWLAALVSLGIWLAVTAIMSGRRILARLSWSFVGAVYGGFALLAAFALSWQLNESLSNRHTYQWRVARWHSSFATYRSKLEWLAGGAFGPTPASVNTQFRGVYAHSLYVWAIETVGIAGLALMVVLIVSICLRPRAIAAGTWPLVVGCMALAVGYSYGLPDWLWLAVAMCSGWALPAAMPREATERTSRSRPLPVDRSAGRAQPQPGG